MKNAPADSLYIKNLKIYDKDIFSKIYIKKNNKYISLKTEKSEVIDEKELIKLTIENSNLGKVDIQDIKYVASRYASKANFDPNIIMQRKIPAVNHGQIRNIIINPFNESIDKYRLFIENMPEIEKIRNKMDGECEIKGVISIGADNTINNLKVSYNYDSVSEPMNIYFTRKLKKLQLEKKKKGLFN